MAVCVWLCLPPSHTSTPGRVTNRGVATPVLLPAPRHGDMHMLCPEALDAIVHVKLLRHASSGSGETTVMFQGSGRHGGLEVAGDTAALARQALAQGAGINPLDVASMLWGAAMRKVCC